ncbi:MAG: competence/damage-inducible protein A [Bacteroidales bacterium]|nr:competence/damage-inducible protein A [Bacteroidales bacterium]
MKATLINIGDELLIGQVINTNAAQMSRMMNAGGFDVVGVYTIGDRADAIRDTLDSCLKISDIVLVTGGLGPTKDDITKKVLCDFFHSELYENGEALENVKRRLAAHGRELTPINRLQAWIPRCCTFLNNPLGTAPGMWFEVPGSQPASVVVSLPGVPFEMANLMETEVIPRLRSHFRQQAIFHKNLLVQGIGESFLSDLIEPWERALPENVRLAYLPQPGLTKLRLTARGSESDHLQQQVSELLPSLYSIAGPYIVGEDRESMPELVAEVMRACGKTLSTAESCTGGMLAAKLTALAGASEYFSGGVVSYSNDVKENVLGVRHETLEQWGAVSEQTVREMVCGVRERLDTDYALATTGIAGPGGGTPEKPVGTVWIAVASRSQVFARKLQCPGKRAQVVDRTCNELFGLLVRVVHGKVEK